MRLMHNRPRAVLACLVAAGLGGCSASAGLRVQSGTAMLVAIGSPRPDYGLGTAATSGAYRLRENPTRFEALGWSGLSASHIASAEGGRWLYVATDDGVLVSQDGGASFWMTGATVLRSVRRIAAIPGHPEQVFAATSTGIYFTQDITASTDSWRPFKPTSDVQLCNDVQIDIHDPQTIWVGSDRGVFLAESQDPRFRKMTDDVQVHQVLQDRVHQEHLWAATRGEGLLKSSDRGKTWTRVAGVSGPCYSISHYPTSPDRIIVTGEGKVWTRGADYTSWDFAELPSSTQPAIYDIAFDPRNPGIAVLATSDGIFGTRNGSPWIRIALPQTKVMAIRYSSQHDQRAQPFQSPARSNHQVTTAPKRPREVADPGYAARQRRVGRALARHPMPDPASDDFFFAALGRLREDRGSPAYWQRVREALARPVGTQRSELGRRAFFHHCERLMPAKLRASMQKNTALRGLVRGRGEHCWMVYYATVLLTSAMLPDPRSAQWFNGLSTEDNVRTATDGLMHWATTLGHKGQMDCDSPCDLPETVATLLLLHDFIEDPAIQRIATNALDLILADRLSESLGGVWCGAHNRLSTQELLNGTGHELAALHYLFADGIEQPEGLPMALSVAAYSFYLPLPLLHKIANYRQQPYVVQKTKRTSDSHAQHGPCQEACRKYTYMTQTYAMASLARSTGPVMTRLPWNLTWRNHGAPSVLFPTLTPHRPKATSDSSGASTTNSSRPSLSAQQSRNTLLLLYDLPTPHAASISLPPDLRLEEVGGWLFGFDGDFHVAIRPSKKGHLSKAGPLPARRFYRSHGKRIGFVVIAGSTKVAPPGQSKPETHQQFKRRVLNTPQPRITVDSTTVAWTHTFADKSGIRVTNQRVDTGAEQKLFDSPFLSASIGTGSIQVSNGNRGHQIDFGSLR